MPAELTELREQRDSLNSEVAKVFEEAKSADADGKAELDLRKATSLPDEIKSLDGTAKTVRIVEWIRTKTAEVDDLSKQIEALEEAERLSNEYERKEREPVKPIPFPEGERKERKSFGRRVTEHPIFKKWQAGSRDGQIVLEDVGLKELKTLFETTAGWAPESTRTGYVLEHVTRPLQILDIIPTGNTSMPTVKYMEETTRTHAASETAEGGTYPESTFELTEQSSDVRKIADSVPVTDEQLEDVPMVESYLEGRLNFGVQQRLDGQIIAGTGTGSPTTLRGITNVVGIQTQAKAGDPTPDAFYKAMTNLRVTGRVIPTHHAFHPNDWQQVKLLRTNDGIYIWGSPSEASPDRLWGLPVVLNEALSEGTGLVGSFLSPWITLFERRGIIIERGFTGTQFVEGKQTIRASGRWALVVFRPAAFCTVTGI